MKQLLSIFLIPAIIAACRNAGQTNTVTPDTIATKMSTDVSKDSAMIKDTTAKNAGDNLGIIGNKNTTTLNGDDSVNAGLRMKGLKDSSINKKNKKASKVADSSQHR